jgi:tRNA-specific 2-thiouridylase
MEYGCEKIVTGHYARIEKVKEGYLLKKAIDDTKDQSYVLYSMTQEQLKHTEFPIGELKKIQVRKIAKENSFINEDKPDSQDICFVPDGDYVGAIKRLSGKEYESGLIRDMEGNIRGHHDGIIRYTTGQRKGLRISSDRPLYVCSIDADNNEVIVGSNENLYSKEVHVKNVNWISPWLISDGMKVKTKIRYRQKEQRAILNLSIESDDEATIVFDEPQRAITKGQAAVIYLGDIVLGGGIIS